MNEPPNPEVAIFAAALELAADQRGAYLDQACAGNVALRGQVEALLRVQDEAGSFFDKLASVAQPTSAEGATPGSSRTLRIPSLASEKPGDRIGRYKLLQQIGEGGCGVVYMAEQEEPVRRRVALKVIKLGMDTKSVIARFEAERQALALMDHPNIAKVLDAGATETGRPYFVMELVRGIRITDYCNQNSLSTVTRLELFIQVCQAIQHAHQKGIIHRDIKPSNILVADHDGMPVPKIIDFGIAKATTDQRLTDKTLFTAFEQFIGTPAYMSPEQAKLSGLDIDTRSDIYSLGVLLYELLMGKTPFESDRLLEAGLDEIRRIIREEEPVRPSTKLQTLNGAEQTTVAKHRQTDPPKLAYLIRGDLDWIVMKCLEKDRARRYETASGLAADIQRHLSNETVDACPPSGLYRLQKSIRRNKGAFSAAAVIAAVLVVGVVTSTLEAIRATRAEREQNRLRLVAETREKENEEVSQFLKDMLKGVGPSVALGRDTTMLHEIVDKTADRIGTDLKDQPEVEFELRSTLTQVYYDLQIYNKMEENARETLRLARLCFGDENPAVAEALRQLGVALMSLRDADEAERVTGQAIAMERKVRGDGSVQEGLALRNLGDALRHQAGLHSDPGKLQEAEDALRKSLAILRKQLGNDNDEVGWTLYALATVLWTEGKHTEAVSVQREALAIRQKIHGEDYPATAEDYCQLGALLAGESDTLNEGVNDLRKGLEILKKTQGEGKYRQSWAENSLANALLEQGKLEDAEIHFHAAVTNARNVMGADCPDLPYFIEGLVNALRQEGKLAEARARAEDAVAICQRIPNLVDRATRQRASDLLRDVLTDLGDTPALVVLYQNILAQQRAALGDNNPAVAETLVNLAGALLAQGKQADAEQAYQDSLAVEEKLPDDERASVAYSSSLADFLRRSGKLIEAGPMAREAAQNSHASMAKYEKLASDPDRHNDCWGFAISYEVIGDVLNQTGQTQEAEKAYQDTQVLWRKLVDDFETEDYCFHLAVNYCALGNMLRETGRATESLAAYRAAQAVWVKSVADFNTEYHRMRLGWTEEDIGLSLKEAGKFDEATEAYRQAMAVWKKLVADFNKDDYRDHLSATMVNLATTLQAEGKRTEAEQIIREATEHASANTLNELAWSQATGPDPGFRDGPSAVTFAESAVTATSRKNVSYLDTLAAAYAETGQFAKAVATQKEAIALSRSEDEKKDLASRLKLYESNSPYRDDGALAMLAMARLGEGKFVEAEGLARECLAIREIQMPNDWRTFNARSMLGGSLLGQKKYAEAEPLLLSGYEGLKQRADQIPPASMIRPQEALQRLVQLYENTERSDQAIRWKNELSG